MLRKVFSRLIIIVSCILGVCFTPLFPKNIPDTKEETWAMISNYFECFLADPVANFPLIERVDDIYYWTVIYDHLNDVDIMKKILARHFEVEDVDEAKLNILFSLLLKYSLPCDYYGPIKAIIARLVEIAAIRPDWLIENLLQRSDWREIIRLIYQADIDCFLKTRKGLKEFLSSASNSELRGEIMDFYEELDKEDLKEFERFEEFMKDPVGNFDKIKNIYNLCATMGNHDMLHRDENKTLWPKDNSVLILEEWIKKETDEKKVKMLLHLLCHCDSAYHSEVLGGIAFEVFLEHQQMFVACLKGYKNWRSLIYEIRFDLYYHDIELNRIINNLGNSEFENKLKAELIFLRKIVKEEEEKYRKKALWRKF